MITSPAGRHKILLCMHIFLTAILVKLFFALWHVVIYLHLFVFHGWTAVRTTSAILLVHSFSKSFGFWHSWISKYCKIILLLKRFYALKIVCISEIGVEPGVRLPPNCCWCRRAGTWVGRQNGRRHCVCLDLFPARLRQSGGVSFGSSQKKKYRRDWMLRWIAGQGTSNSLY